MRNSKYIGLWSLILIALIVIIGYSFIEDVSIMNHTLKKSSFKESLLGSGNEALKDSLKADSVRKVLEEELKKVTTDSMPQSIFIFGDSMTWNLALRLAQYAKHNGHTINAVNWDSSNTKIWAEHDTLIYFINKYKPTQVFISLGSNELYFKDPSKRKPYVEKILEMIDTIPYVWIGPPNWEKDNGLNDMLEEICLPGSFFRTDGMSLKRKADHIHPTREASALWIDSIMRWIPGSAHPFIVNLPPDSIGKPKPNIIFLKALNK